MHRTKQFRGLVNLAALAGLAAHGYAQAGSAGWYYECIDPRNTAPYEVPTAANTLTNQFIGVNMGLFGGVTYGSDQGPCYPAAKSNKYAGRFSFFVGGIGSVQSDFDDALNLTMGAPTDAGGDYTYARIINYTQAELDAARTAQSSALLNSDLWGGDSSLNGFFVGASKRYMVGIYTANNVETTCTVRVIGDAVRMEWTMLNRSAETRYLGLMWGMSPWMRTANSGITDAQGANQSLCIRPFGRAATQVAKPVTTQADGSTWFGYITTPNSKPIRAERSFLATRSSFPQTINYLWGQSDPYGLRLDNSSFPETPDADRVAHVKIGNHGYGSGAKTLDGNNMNLRVFTDFGSGDPFRSGASDVILEEGDTLLNQACQIQTFAPLPVTGFRSRTVIHYIRSPWAVADYRDPYACLVDAPRVVATGAGTNGLTPNPLRIVAYVDNQYATLDREVPLTNVRITINLPEGGGLRLANGEPQVKTIANIPANEIANVEWSVVADGKNFGRLPYSVTFAPTPGNAKTLSGSVLVSATPKIRLAQGPNLITLPWDFADTSLESILGLKPGVDFVAYQWSGDIGEYVPVQSAARGQAVWIVPTSDQGTRDLVGATSPADIAAGGYNLTLRPGWNMVGNPTNYPIPIGQLLAVPEDAPQTTLTWQELVDNQFVQGSFAFWQRNPEDPASGTYGFTTGVSDILQPNTGYWVFVNSFNPIRVFFPAVYVEGLPGSTRTGSQADTKWVQGDKQWRLQLSARTADGIDAYNYVGVAADAKAASRLAVNEPPKSPKQRVQLSIEESQLGKTTRMAQTLVASASRREWKVLVSAETAGDVTVTWPNISSVPRNVAFQVVDKATNTQRDLRFASGYTFRMDQPGTRELTIRMEPGVAGRAVIGDVIVTRPSRDSRAPFTINYSLSAQSTTSIRILGGAGKEVFTVTRGRADRVGENSATWAMRDNANRAVAPGVYQVEILAETPNGERVRKIVPVNVVR